MTEFLQTHQKLATLVAVLLAAGVVALLYALSRSNPAPSAAVGAYTSTGNPSSGNPTAANAAGDTAGSGPGQGSDIHQADVTMLTGAETAPSWKLENVLYVDVNNDGFQEAVVLVRGDGESRPLDWRIYAMKNGQPVQLFERTGLAQGGLSVKGPALVESEGVFAPGDAECCPSSAKRTYYVWKGDALVVSRVEATPPGGAP